MTASDMASAEDGCKQARYRSRMKAVLIGDLDLLDVTVTLPKTHCNCGRFQHPTAVNEMWGMTMRKPVAVQRRDYIASSGPTIYGIRRMDKVTSPRGETFIFLGVREGEVILERETKTPQSEPFVIVDSSEFAAWKKK